MKEKQEKKWQKVKENMRETTKRATCLTRAEAYGVEFHKI